MGTNGGCPWMTAVDRCLGHVGGTAGEDEPAHPVQRWSPAQREGELVLGDRLPRWQTSRRGVPQIATLSHHNYCSNRGCSQVTSITTDAVTANEARIAIQSLYDDGFAYQGRAKPAAATR
jgi:hypothetical protein